MVLCKAKQSANIKGNFQQYEIESAEFTMRRIRQRQTFIGLRKMTTAEMCLLLLVISHACK